MKLNYSPVNYLLAYPISDEVRVSVRNSVYCLVRHSIKESVLSFIDDFVVRYVQGSVIGVIDEDFL